MRVNLPHFSLSGAFILISAIIFSHVVKFIEISPFWLIKFSSVQIAVLFLFSVVISTISVIVLYISFKPFHVTKKRFETLFVILCIFVFFDSVIELLMINPLAVWIKHPEFYFAVPSLMITGVYIFLIAQIVSSNHQTLNRIIASFFAGRYISRIWEYFFYKTIEITWLST